MAFMPVPENIVEHAKNAQQKNRHRYGYGIVFSLAVLAMLGADAIFSGPSWPRGLLAVFVSLVLANSCRLLVRHHNSRRRHPTEPAAEPHPRTKRV